MTDKRSLEEPLNPLSNDIDQKEAAKIDNDNNLHHRHLLGGQSTLKEDEESLENGNSAADVVDENNEDGDMTPRPPVDNMSPEAKKLGGYPPLITLFRLSVGPNLSQVTNAVYGVLTSVWVSKAIGEDGLSAVSTMMAFDNIGRGFGFFCAIAASTQISYLFGKGRGHEAAQVIADLIRLCFVFGAIIAAVLIPILKPIARWYGANETIVQLGFDYMIPLNAFAFNSCLFVASGGFLQGEGRTFLFGMENVFCLCFNMLVMNPIFLFAVKMGIKGVSYATIISEFIPMIVVVVLFFNKKFGVKPELKQLLMKFSPNTPAALKVGVSSLISQLSICIPSIMVRKYIGMSCGGEFTWAMAGFNAATRFNMVTFAVFQAFSQAFIPAASYAFAAKKYRRYLRLAFHAVWINVLWGSFTFIFSWSIPKQIALVFSDGEGYLKWATKMIQINNALGPISGFKMNGQSICQSMQLGPRATILSFLNNFVAIVAATLILYYTNKNDGARLMWCYPLSQAASMVLSIIFLFSPLKNLYKLAKEEEQNEKLELNDIQETGQVADSTVEKLSNGTDSADEKKFEDKELKEANEVEEV